MSGLNKQTQQATGYLVRCIAGLDAIAAFVRIVSTAAISAAMRGVSLCHTLPTGSAIPLRECPA